ncbi:MAG: coenzyme F420-0:L-glutamate ligase [Xanthobacteraceae bacterium]|nr:coenzyme F420-0:L-glutamate ligase [Xanthobacteraceae bacterium]MCW5678227.1 coenzyme F420-0:L-glutamate ligase [Xanthobacteraceae bacterium]
MQSSDHLSIFAIPGLPLVEPGANIANAIIEGLSASKQRLEPNDVIVIAQKIVSKAEGRYVTLSSATPSPRAEALAKEVGKDPRVVELIVRESVEVVRRRTNVLIVEHRLGYVMANAGIDASNVAPLGGEELVLLLPEAPDESAALIKSALEAAYEGPIGVIINDSFGRPWRMGSTSVCLGSAGVPTLNDMRGQPDLFGRPLKVTLVAIADELASAASVVQGQAAESRPVVVVRGLKWDSSAQTGRELIRPQHEDLFR